MRCIEKFERRVKIHRNDITDCLQLKNFEAYNSIY